MGAISALKGYRTQFLYSLYRILKDRDKDYVFHIEGKFEDLDILDYQGNYIESIQIKNKGANLVFSDLFSVKDSFFSRTANLIQKNINVKIKIVSFSQVSEELKDISKLEKKLKKKRFNQTKIDNIIKNYEEPEIVNELDLENNILNYIKEFSIFTDPKIALELLLFWIYKSGENQKEITTENFISDLNKIGKFISEQSAFHNQFGNIIIPIASKTLENENKEQLKKGFYYGVSAKYEHILSDLDVVRNEKLELINNALNKNDIVFIHGASGQGKSTLAYRYLHNYSNTNTIYELKISNNLSEIYETINALDALSKGLKFPITAYIDVSPQNNYWNEILKELSNKSNLKFLITIRQEDWNRTILGEDFDFEDIELVFDKKEAELIYDSLSKYKIDLKFTDFEETWLKFGNNGMLLEYVYLINQGDKLKVRLQNQVIRLEQEKRVEELEILKYVCLSDAFNSKINYTKIINQLDINKSLSNPFIKLLEKEYLLKFSDNKKYLTGLHPIRSRLLCEIFFYENEYLDIHDYISNSISLIDEEDLHIFLLHSFEKKYSILKLQKALLNKTHPSSWTGHLNIFNALLWKGIYDFIFKKNKTVFDTLYNDYTGFWNFMLPYDYSGVTNGSIHEIFTEILPENVNTDIQQIQSQFTSKNDIYEYVISWLKNTKTFSASILNNQDISSFGKFTFWIGHLELINDVQITFNEDDVHSLCQSKIITLEAISELISGLKHLEYSEAPLKKIKDIAINRLRNEFNIINLDIDNDVNCTYFYNPLNHEDNSSEENLFHKRTMEIITLLRNIFPFKEKYKIKGKGKTFLGLEMPYDPTDKDIERKNLPLPYLVQINVMINNLYSYQYRPQTWLEYSSLIKNKRDTYNKLCTSLINTFIKYFKNNDYKEFINVISEIEIDLKKTRSIPFPKNISDRWGYISEGNSDKIEDENTHKHQSINLASLSKYKSYKKSQRDYFSSLENFLNQIGQNIVSIYKIRTGSDKNEDYNSNAISNNIRNALLNYPIYFDEFDKHFTKFFNEAELKKINKIEDNNLITLHYSWKQILNQKDNVKLKIRKNALKSFSETKINLIKKLKTERQKILNEFGLSFTVELNSSNDKLGKILLLTCDVDSETYLTSWIIARMLVQNTLHSDYFSLKKIIIESNIKSVIYVPLFAGLALNQTGVEIHLHNLENEINDDNLFSYFNPLYKISKGIINHLDLTFWNKRIPEIKDYENIMGELLTLKEFKNQITSLKFEQKDEIGEIVLTKYIREIDSLLNDRIRTAILNLENISSSLEDDELYHNILNAFENFSLKSNNINDLENIQNRLHENYYSFSEKQILKLS